MTTKTTTPPTLSFAWLSLEEARLEFEHVAAYHVIHHPIPHLPVPTITITIQWHSTTLSAPAYATALHWPNPNRHKVFAYMWVQPPHHRLRFTPAWITQVEFVLGRLYQEQYQQLHQDTMVSTIFHEIRNPLTAILNAVDLLLHVQDESVRDHNLQLIETNVSYLLQVTTDLLELFRMSQNRIDLQMRPTNLQALFAEVADIFPNVRVTWVIADHVPHMVNCDATKYKQILINLVANSRKFGALEIVIRAAYRQTILYTEVADNGPGIEESLLVAQDLFKSLGKSTTGLGIGLFMCRKLLQLMQGEIYVKQNSEHGCTLAFHFPAPAVVDPSSSTTETTTTTTTTAHPKQQQQPQPQHILIVDDHIAVRDTLQQLIKFIVPNAATDTAANGYEAVEKAKLKTYDWIFLDLKMPRKSGWQAAKEIFLFSAPRIIFISAYALTVPEKIASQELGVAGFIQKPFRKNDIAYLLLSQGPRARS